MSMLFKLGRLGSTRPQNFRKTTSIFQTGIRAALFSVEYLKLEMPALSPTMTEGKIAKWVVEEGGRVDIGDVVCEIQTDKATVGYESQEEGYIGKIL